MGSSYQITDPHGIYFLTFQVVDWVDIFSRKIYRDIVVDSLNFCVANKHLKITAWVIMSNHVHAIMHSEQNNLSDIVRDFKAHTGREILKQIETAVESRQVWMQHVFAFNARKHKRNEKQQLWTHENHAVYLEPTRPEMLESRINYIHQNPVRAGWVELAEHYLYSSAVDYTGRKGLVNIETV
ncbi:MAG: transposase [Chitinophagales bacterium]|nr:transposase [Chitinophagales bacterium]